MDDSGNSDIDDLDPLLNHEDDDSGLESLSDLENLSDLESLGDLGDIDSDSDLALGFENNEEEEETESESESDGQPQTRLHHHNRGLNAFPVFPDDSDSDAASTPHHPARWPSTPLRSSPELHQIPDDSDSDLSHHSRSPSTVESDSERDSENDDDDLSSSLNSEIFSDSDLSEQSDLLPDSPDSLFVQQNLPSPARRQLDDELENLRRQAEQLTRRHAELARIATNLHQSVRERRDILRQRAFPPVVAPVIPRRRRFEDDQLLGDQLFGAARFPLRMDELVEMEVGGANGQRANRTPGPARQPTVIDLTDEPDSPEEVIYLPDQAFHRNRRIAGAQNQDAAPRHHNPHRPLIDLRTPARRTPSLARSDGSILGAPFIDLTDMPDDDNPYANAGPGRANQAPRPALPLPRQPIVLDDGDEGANRGRMIDMLGRVNRITNGIDNNMAELTFFHRILHQVHTGEIEEPVNPLGQNMPMFNYRANGYNNEPPKPAHIPPPPPREGFSRDTGGEDAFVCPSCEEELKFDPDEKDASPPTKRARSRKDNEEHHFWAVKECGHVSSFFPSSLGSSLTLGRCIAMPVTSIVKPAQSRRTRPSFGLLRVAVV